MRRLAMLALAGAAAFMPAATAGPGYTRECGGTVDIMCWEHSCRFVDCFRFDCLVYIDVTHNGFTICVPVG